MTELPKAYTPRDVEGVIYERWLAADVFAPDGAGSTADQGLPPFTIIQPPPNVTGSLHLGHAQRTAVEDLLIRHARMRGHRTLFLPGLDHASIAAQFVLDGILAKEGESRQSLGRDRYLERMRAFSDSTKPVMLAQQRRVGASADWGRLRYTMDDGSAQAVRVAFERLYRDGLAYRTEALVNWCPGCRTSVSDLEVVPTPETGTLWSVRYHLIDQATGEPSPDETITVATTRPETILGDVARESRSSSGTCRSSPTRSSTGRSARARSRSRPPTTRTTTRPASATGCRCRPSSPTMRRSPTPGLGTTASTAMRRGS
jgi:valyl-tRNA synthetase